MSNPTIPVDAAFLAAVKLTARNLYKNRRGVYLGVDAIKRYGIDEWVGSVYIGYDLLDEFRNVVGTPRYTTPARVQITTHSDRPEAQRYVATQPQGYTGEIVGALTALANTIRLGDELIVTFTFGSKSREILAPEMSGMQIGPDRRVVEDTADLTVVRKNKGIATFRIETVLRILGGGEDPYSFASYV
jgi:hypothetical protein